MPLWPPMPTLWATPADRKRLLDAESVLFLVGSYDGSGNYGDILQSATAIETVNELPGSPLAVPVVERETHGHHSELMGRYREEFAAAAFVFFHDREDEPDDGLVEIASLEANPPAALIYIYGGGFMNSWWGVRKAAHVKAAEQLLGERPLQVVASGLQVEETAIAPGGSRHDLLSRAAWIGVRDVDSLMYVRRQITHGDRVKLAGDNAMPFLGHQSAEPNPVVNLHLNDGSWISDKPRSLPGKVVALLRNLGLASEEPLELQPVIAYEDPHVSEGQIISNLLEQRGDELEEAGLMPTEPLDALEDAIGNDLATFRRARLTVSCSYHVTLTSLLAGIPAVFFAQNDYYAQKAAGPRDLFQLGPKRVGVSGTEEDAQAAIEALVDGAPRARLVSHLQAQSRRVSVRFNSCRAALSVALTEGLARAR
jgi:Polysaccharide pyruvyl transferase